MRLLYKEAYDLDRYLTTYLHFSCPLPLTRKAIKILAQTKDVASLSPQSPKGSVDVPTPVPY